MLLKYFYTANIESVMPPKLQCHRGYWIEGLPQNSLASIKKAYELGYGMSEFDIRITKDGEVILFHDDVIGNRKISDLTLAEVNALHPVDGFQSVLEWFKTTAPGSYYLNIEIKSRFKINRSLETKVLQLILKYNVQERVLISSFNPLSLYYFRRHYPRLTRALLLTYSADAGNNSVLRSQVLNLLARPHLLHLDESNWSPQRFNSLLQRGIPVVLWTCNDPEKVKKYFLQGVFGVISDKLKPSDLLKM